MMVSYKNVLVRDILLEPPFIKCPDGESPTHAAVTSSGPSRDVGVKPNNVHATIHSFHSKLCINDRDLR